MTESPKILNKEHREFYEKLKKAKNRKEAVELLKKEHIGGYSKMNRQEIVSFFAVVSPIQVFTICNYLKRKSDIQVAKKYLDFSDWKGVEYQIEKMKSGNYEGKPIMKIDYTNEDVYKYEEDETYVATGNNSHLNGRYEYEGTEDEEESGEVTVSDVSDEEERISGFCPDCRIDMDGEKHGLPFCTDCGMIRWADGSYSHR